MRKHGIVTLLLVLSVVLSACFKQPIKLQPASYTLETVSEIFTDDYIQVKILYPRIVGYNDKASEEATNVLAREIALRQYSLAGLIAGSTSFFWDSPPVFSLIVFFVCSFSGFSSA